MAACIICKSNKKDDLLYGEFLQNKNMGVHTYCLYLSSNLSQNGGDDEGFLGFLEADIKKEVWRISQLKCVYCHKSYANIGCCQPKCRKTFHLICGLENFAENQFCNDFRSYCHKHINKGKRRPTYTDTCLICFDSIWQPSKKFNAITMIQAPCCHNGWFHKLCLQKFATTSGYFFKCPLCNDVKVFRAKLPAKGIFIPNHDAEWEREPNAFAELLERPSECSAQECNFKQGRKVSNSNNPFVMCSTCGSSAMHKQCLPKGLNRFHCADCTIAIEEESINSHNNHDENDEVDVCHVSDKEDIDIVATLMGYNEQAQSNKTVVNESDSEETQDDVRERRRNDSESSDNKPGVSKRTKKMTKTRKIRSDSERSTDLEEELKTKSEQTNSQKTTKKISSDTENTTDKENIFPTTTSSEDEIILKAGQNRTRVIQSDSEDETFLSKLKSLDNLNSDRPCNSSKGCEDETILKAGQKRSHTITSYSENEDISTKTKRFSNEDENIYTKNVSIITEDSDEDDDPLENFTKIIERQKNISCIALRTRRKSSSQHLERLSDVDKNPIDKEALTNKETVKGSINHTKNEDLCTNTKRFSNENSKNLPSNSKSFKDKEVDEINSKNTSITTEDSDEDDDPLENFNKIEERQNNISCIALRTRRKSQYIERPSDVDKNSLTNKDAIKETTSGRRREHFERPHSRDSQTFNRQQNIEKKALSKDKKTSNSTRFKLLNDEPKAKNLDISCIAKRTRRKTMFCTRTTTKEKDKDKPTSSTNSLNISCIAIRTRRKTICGLSAKEQKEEYKTTKPFEMSQIYEKLNDSSENEGELDDTTEEDKELHEITEEESDIYEENEESDINDFIVSDDYEKIDGNRNTSCIAKRTRKRNTQINDSICSISSSDSNYQSINSRKSSNSRKTTNSTTSSKSNDSSTSSSYFSNFSSSSSSAASCSSDNVNLRKRSYNRIESSSSEETKTSSSSSSKVSSSSDTINLRKRRISYHNTTILSSSSEETRTSQTSNSLKTNLNSRVIEKFPVQNYAAFLKSSKTTNSNHNYYPNNQYHPHNYNRKRV